MGHSSYSVDARTIRATSVGYDTKSKEEIFTQSKSRTIHSEMSPVGVVFRESRDSDAHPLTIPIQLYLDVTGSMGHIPHEMIKNGLPKLMGTLIQRGLKDASLMFGAIGDHECDRFPLQIGQFESGDSELDMWLTRTYLEGGGGENAGESYPLAWYFAAQHTRTDAWEKRQTKGFVFTVGDEPYLRGLPVSALKKIMGDTATGQDSYAAEDLYAAACVQNHVYHIHIEHGGVGLNHKWKELLGNNLIVLNDYTALSSVLADVIYDVSQAEKTTTVPTPVQDVVQDVPSSKEEML